MARKRVGWSLEELIDFEVLLGRSKTDRKEVGREMRQELKEADLCDDELGKRRHGLKYWLLWEKLIAKDLFGSRVVTASRLVAVILGLVMFLVGIGVIRGLVTTYSYETGPYQVEVEAQAWTAFDLSSVNPDAITGQIVETKGFNIWVLLAVTLGLQWVLLIAGLIGFLLFRKWSPGLKSLLASLISRFAGGLSKSEWARLYSRKKQQRSALSWRLGSVLQLAGVGYNFGLLIGLFGVLWFSKVGFYWESSLPIGAPSLQKTTEVMAIPWGGDRPVLRFVELTQTREETDYKYEDVGVVNTLPLRVRANLSWSWFFFLAIMVWGLIPRMVALFFSMWKERSLLAKLDFQDREHRQLWRDLNQVERTVSMEGMGDGVVLCDVGGLEVSTSSLRPFLLQTLRVNPEERYSLSVLDVAEEKDAWNAIRKAPCGVVILVEGWSLSPKQFTLLWQRMRQEAGLEIAIRVLVIGDGGRDQASAPSEEEMKSWQDFLDGLRDPLMECVSYQPKGAIES